MEGYEIYRLSDEEIQHVYGDISPTGLKNHFANAEQLEKYGIEYNP